jgi:SAM-dependent methyltransferase
MAHSVFQGEFTMTEFLRFAEQERSGWTNKNIVDAYISKFGPITDQVGKDLVARISASDKSVLDLCCGQGTLTAMLCNAGASVTGIDFSQEMLDIAEQTAPNATLQRADATALPCDDESFDFAVCNFGMMHLPDQPKALSEIHRVLRTHGQFLMATWAAPEASPAFATVLGAIKEHADLSNAPQQPDLFTFARVKEASELFGSGGLQMVAHDTIAPAWKLTRPDELFDIFLTATVGVSMLIKGQQPEVVEKVRNQISSTVKANFAGRDGYQVPVPVVITIAAKT